MAIIRIDDLTTISLDKAWQLSKILWELFPYQADIDLVENTYDGQPMDNAQIKTIRNFVFDEQSVIDFDDDLYKKIRDRTIASFRNHEVTVSYEHGTLLSRMAMVMANLNYKEFPVIITARPGLGKTQMLKASLIEKLKANGEENDYLAIVVTRRVQDGLAISKELNDELGTDSCWVRPSFTLMTLDGQKCANGHLAKDHHPTICRRENCAQGECPVKSWRRDFEKYAVVFITSEFFQHSLDNNSLKDLMEREELNLDEIDPGLHYLYDPFNQATEGFLTFYRDELIIDENPGMIFNPAINNRMLNDCMNHLKSNSFPDEIIQEYASIMKYVSGEIPGALEHEYVEPPDQIPAFTNQFKKAWDANPHPNYPKLPLIINSFVKDGGIRQRGNKFIEYAIGVSRYRSLKDLPFRTVILDGSGLKDLTYKQNEFYILDIPEIRDYSRAIIHVYSKNLSKAFYFGDNSKKKAKVTAVAEEAISVLGDRPSLFITYGKLEKQFKKLFKEHPNIRVNHFGNLIGSNAYHDCTAVFFAGTNDWGPFEYFLQATEISGKELDLTTIQQKTNRFVDPLVNEFYQTLLAVGVYQDLMRSNLRVVSDMNPVDVYIWTAAMEVVQQVTELLPKTKEPVIENVPSVLVGENQPKPIATKHKRILDNYLSTLNEDDVNKRAKYKSIGLTKALGQIPSSAEYEYIWGPIKHGHYSRIKGYAENWLKAQKEL